MKTILFSALTILIVVLVYFLFFYPGGSETTRIAGSNGRGINARFVSNKETIHNYDMMENKMSMRQIDSMTASEDWHFTSQNYNKDVVPVEAAELKTKKL